MIWIILTILFYGIGDLWTTKKALSYSSIEEANPIMRYVINHTGFKGLIIVKAIIITYSVVYLYSAIWIMAIMGVFLTVWNIGQIYYALSNGDNNPVTDS